MKSLRVWALLATGAVVLSAPAIAPAQWQTQPQQRPQWQQSSAQPSLVGTWNSQFPSQQGMISMTAQYRGNGTFDVVMLMPVQGYTAPIYMHFWGRYQMRATGANRYGVQISLAGQAPSEACQSINGGPPSSCRPMNPSTPPNGSVQFLSANSFRDESGAVFSRINGLGLLAQRVPARVIFNTVASGGGGGTGYGGGGYVSPYRGGGGTVTVQHPGNLQQERICTINDGTLVTYPDGREECKGPN